MYNRRTLEIKYQIPPFKAVRMDQKRVRNIPEKVPLHARCWLFFSITRTMLRDVVRDYSSSSTYLLFFPPDFHQVLIYSYLAIFASFFGLYSSYFLLFNLFWFVSSTKNLKWQSVITTPNLNRCLSLSNLPALPIPNRKQVAQ